MKNLRSFTLFFYYILFSANIFSQNLIPNGDFEEMILCPDNQSASLSHTTFWLNPSYYPPYGSPDYWHECTESGAFDIPSNWMGYQLARSGNACAGIVVSHGTADFREYLEVPLTSELIAEQCYHFKMYVNLPDNSTFTANHIGVLFSDTLIDGVDSFYPLPYTPQIYLAGALPDTASWTAFTGDYLAQGGEQFLIIGNFSNDLNSPLTLYNIEAYSEMIYFIIDDVSLVECNAANIETQGEPYFSIFPNPANDILTIDSDKLEQEEISIFNSLGHRVFFESFKGSLRINIQSFENGFYSYLINDKSQIMLNGKLMIQH
jgi:OmpA-OmpF porin, OOP family